MKRRETSHLGRRLAVLVAAIGGSCALGASASATPAQTAWSTYLRSGPGSTFQVIDELEHGAMIDVGRCQGQWCQIQDGRTVGYIDRDALTLQRLPSGAAVAPAAQNCFVAAQASYRRPDQVRFCGRNLVEKPPVH